MNAIIHTHPNRKQPPVSAMPTIAELVTSNSAMHNYDPPYAFVTYSLRQGKA